jgi:hypothetical protein
MTHQCKFNDRCNLKLSPDGIHCKLHTRGGRLNSEGECGCAACTQPTKSAEKE